MTTGLYKKGLVLAIVCCFIVAGVVPIVNGNFSNLSIVNEKTNTEIEKYGLNQKTWGIPDGIIGVLPWSSGTELVSIVSNMLSSESSLAVEADGTVHVAWAEESYIQDFKILYSYKDANTCTWNPTEIVSTDFSGSHEFDLPSLAVDSSGTVHVVWSGDPSTPQTGIYNVFYKYRTPGPLGIWSTPEQVSQSVKGRYSSLAVEADGTVHVIWWDTNDYLGNCGPDPDVYYRKRSSGSVGIWSNIEAVSTESVSGGMELSLAVEADGTVHAVWIDASNYINFPEADIFYKKRDISGWPTVTEVVSKGGIYQNNIHSRRPSIEVENLTGDVHIIWYDWDVFGGFTPENNIYYRRKPSITGIWDPIEIVSTERTAFLGEPSLALEEIGSGTVVHVAWSDTSIIDYEVMYKSKISGNPWPLITEMVSTETTLGGDPSIDVDLGGTVHISWTDWCNGVYDDLNSGIDSDIFYKSDCCDVTIIDISGSGNIIQTDFISNCPCDLNNINWEIAWNSPSPGPSGSTQGIIPIMSSGGVTVNSNPIPPGASIFGLRTITATVTTDCSTSLSKTGWVLWINWPWPPWSFTFVWI